MQAIVLSPSPSPGSLVAFKIDIGDIEPLMGIPCLWWNSFPSQCLYSQGQSLPPWFLVWVRLFYRQWIFGNTERQQAAVLRAGRMMVLGGPR
jgi:hypothetical protein